jgi:hypothetical protein
MLPPPRPITIRSKIPRPPATRSISTISAAAPSPWTFEGRTTTLPLQPRRIRIRMKSWTAAPVGDVRKPTVPGIRGIGFLRAASKRPSSESLRFRASYSRWRTPTPSSTSVLTTSWYCPRGS